MAMIDPEQERKRLAEFYSHQTDGELERVAQESGSLTDVALQTLRAEMANRGLTQDSIEGAPDADPAEVDRTDADRDGPEFRDLVVVRSYWNLLEAELAKGALDAAGIECFLFDDNMVRLDWFNANALGGVKLRVEPQDAEAAQRILDECAAESASSDEADSES